MTNITTIDFKKKQEPVDIVEEIKEQPKYARMTFDQVTDMKTEELLNPPEVLEAYENLLRFYPGMKYIKQHVQLHLMNRIRI